MMMKRTMCGMVGPGSLAHNRRAFKTENVNPERTQYNICYRDENLKEVYKPQSLRIEEETVRECLR